MKTAPIGRVKRVRPVVVFFEDADLVTGNEPLASAVAIVLPGAPQALNSTEEIQLSATNLMYEPARIDRVRGSNQLRVAIPALRLTLTPVQYNAINNTDNGTTLDLTVRMTDRGDVDVMANVTARLNILLTTTNTTIMPRDYGLSSVALEEGRGPGAPVFATNLTLIDGDLTRLGEIYTYGLEVSRNGQPEEGLLAWSHGALDAARRAWVESARSPSGRLNRTLVLDKTLDDVDVGAYVARWTIRESSGADADNRQVAMGAFNLTIVNVEEAPAVYCDARNTTNNCGYAPARLTLQTVFGAHDERNTGPRRDANTQATVVFTDPDLLALGTKPCPCRRISPSPMASIRCRMAFRLTWRSVSI